jgi:hypothetical protein
MGNPRVKNQDELQQEADNFLQKRLRNVGDAFGAVDDAYMGFMRDKVLQLPQEGSLPVDAGLRGIREPLGRTLFAARHGASSNPQYKYTGNEGGDKAAIIANRALHAGGITAAGFGLFELGGAIVNQFGGPADSPTNAQLIM